MSQTSINLSCVAENLSINRNFEFDIGSASFGKVDRPEEAKSRQEDLETVAHKWLQHWLSSALSIHSLQVTGRVPLHVSKLMTEHEL